MEISQICILYAYKIERAIYKPNFIYTGTGHNITYAWLINSGLTLVHITFEQLNKKDLVKCKKSIILNEYL